MAEEKIGASTSTMLFQVPESGSTLTFTEREGKEPAFCSAGVLVGRKPIPHRYGQSVIDTGVLAPVSDSVGCAFEGGDLAISLAIGTLYATVDGPAPLAVAGDTSNVLKTYALIRISANSSMVIQ